MPRFLFKWLILALTIFAMPHLVGGVSVQSFGAALALAAVLGLLNVILKPILILLTLPLTIISLGLFLFVLNALTLQIAGALVSGVAISSFGSALLCSLIISIVSWVTNVMDERPVRWRLERRVHRID